MVFEKDGVSLNDLITEDGCVLFSIAVYPPFTEFDGIKYKGPCIYLLQILMEHLKLCYKIVPSPNGLYGNEYPNGSWNGLIGQLQQKEAEGGVCPFAITAKRFPTVGMSATVVYTYYGIVYPRPAVEPNFAGFIKPFAPQTWAVIFATALFCIFMSICFNSKFLPDMNKARRESFKAETHYFSYSFWIDALIGQSTPRLPDFDSSRLIMAVWMLMTLILINTFKCNLKAQLIVPKVKLPFDSLEEMVSQEEVKWAFLDGSLVGQYFKPAYETDPDSAMGKGWKYKGQLYSSSKMIIDYVTNRGMACISPLIVLSSFMEKDFTERGKCRMAIATKKLIKTEASFALRKESKFGKLIDPLILRLEAAGILHRLFHDKSFKAMYCFKKPGEESKFSLRALSIVDFLGVCFILGAGYILGIIAFVIEIFISKKKSSLGEKRHLQKKAERL